MSKSDWMDRDTAAKELDRSVRRVIQYAAAGTIRSQQGTDEKTGRPVTYLHSGDVERMREQLQNRKKVAEARALVTVDKPRGLALLSANGNGNANGQFPPLPPWLTVERAEEVSGLSATYLRRLIECGELPARNILEGTRAKAPSWRVHKEDLENLKGKVADV